MPNDLHEGTEPEDPGLILRTRWFRVEIARRTLYLAATVLGVGAAFVVLGTFLPMLFHTYAPAGTYVDVHDFVADDQRTDAPFILARIDRTSRGTYQGDFHVELVRLNDDGTQTWVLGWRREAVIQEGRHAYLFEIPVPNDVHLHEGRYFIRASIYYQTDTGVQRELQATTPRFNLTDPPGSENNSSSERVGFPTE